MTADPAAPVTEPRAELVEAAVKTLDGWMQWWPSGLARAVVRTVLPLLTLADLPAALLDGHEQQIRADDVWAEAKAERERAHAKHGETSMEAQPADALLRLSILMEEVGEVAKEFNDARHSGTLDLAAVRKELVQVCAMAGAWADAIAARGTEGGTR